jgi:hypothetical protein
MNLHPWQEKIFNQITSGGFKPGEMTVMMSGRQTGKSMFTAQAIKRLMDDLNNRPIEDLISSEGTVYGNRYYCVQPVGGNWLEMETWVTETMGKHGGAIWGHDPKKAPLPNERWYANNRKFWFRNEADRTLFVLKWR